MSVDAFVAAMADPLNTVQDIALGAGVTKGVCNRVMKNVTSIAGKLSIILTDIDDTTAMFEQLTKVGSLEVQQNPRLTSLVFAGLLSVEGNAAITKNPALLSVTSLKLQNVYGSFTFEALPFLAGINMPELASVSTRIRFIDCPYLDSVCDIGGRVPPDVGGVDIAGSPRLVRGNSAFLQEGGIVSPALCEGVDVIIKTQSDYDALQKEHGAILGIARVVGNIEILWADIVEVQLSTLLGRVSKTNGGIIIDGCNQLTTLAVVFGDLLTIGGELRIRNNEKLQSVTLSKLATVGSVLSVQQNGRVTRLEMDSLVRVGSTMVISGEPALSSTALAPGFLFGSLKSLGGLVVQEISSVTEIILPALTEVKEDFVIDTLSGLSILSADNLGVIGAGMTLKGAPLLSSVSMTRLVTVGGTLAWIGLGALSSVAMPTLSSAQSLTFSGLSNLQSLCGFGLTVDGVERDVQILGSSNIVQGPKGLLDAGGLVASGPCPTMPALNISNVTVWYNTTATPTTTEPLCMQCCPIPSYSFTPETYGFSVAGAFVLGSMFGLLATFCCMNHARTETNANDDLVRKNNTELLNLASQGYQMNQLNEDVGMPGLDMGLGMPGDENDIIY